MPPLALEYLEHILDESDYLINQTQGLRKDEFMQDDTLQRAFVRSLEIIGKATKNIPLDLRREYNHVEWRAISFSERPF